MSSRQVVFRITALATAVLFAVILCEAAARLYVWTQLPAQYVTVLTTPSSARGRYCEDDTLPYLLNPSHPEHNSYGFKGPEFDPLADKLRIVCVGGSTTYGGGKPYAECLQELLNATGVSAEVLNAGVPGWTSKENLLNLRRRVLPLKPDWVIIYQGRNDLIPQAYNGFKDDYSHFRVPEYDFANSNYSQKKFFRASHLCLVLGRSFPSISGWDAVAEHPVFGSVQYQNKPSVEKLNANLREPERTNAYRRNLGEMIRLVEETGASVLLGTFAFLPEKSQFGRFLPDGPSVCKSLEVQMNRNNQVVIELGAQHAVPVAPTHILRDDADLFYDDCHMNEVGHSRRARIFSEALLRQLAANIE